MELTERERFVIGIISSYAVSNVDYINESFWVDMCDGKNYHEAQVISYGEETGAFVGGDEIELLAKKFGHDISKRY